MGRLNLTGVKELTNGRYQLQRMYKKILRLLENVPEEAAYRVNTEHIICHRLAIVENNKEREDIENAICCGKMEMLLSQAHAEHILAQRMLIWRTWEPLVQHAPPGQWKWP